MVIFVMLVISSALMYYYFQRTRALQREVAALKSGIAGGTENGSSLWDWLPWNKAGDAEDESEVTSEAGNGTVAGRAMPAPEPTPGGGAAEDAPVTPQYDESQLPPSGAVSTPRPIAGEISPAGEPAGRLNLYAGTTETEELAPIITTTIPAEPDTLPPGEEPAEAGAADQQEEPAGEAQGQQPIKSMYDELPPVRVRSPRQNREE